MTTRLHLLLSFGVALAGCAGTRFADREILWHDPDEDPIPVPRPRSLSDNWVRARAGLVVPFDTCFGIRDGHEAKNVNALDEVPDSSWFHDPRREAAEKGLPFGPEQVGADPPDAPEPGEHFTIVEGKNTGASHGFIVKDTKGRKLIFKLDAPGYFGLATATEVVAGRLAAAAGWRVPRVSLIELDRDDLEVSPTAKIKNEWGKNRPFTQKDLEQFLDGIPLAPSGKIRVSVSQWIEGKLVGPYSWVGRRKDDPNDRVPHEDRRDLRGYGVFCAWINNIDTIEANTLDSYVGEPGKGHVIHFQQDMGGSFGNYAVGPFADWMGSESYLDVWRILGSVLAFGGWMRPWARDTIGRERLSAIRVWPELGWFEADHFDPRHWSPLWPNAAFVRATRRDRYWGAKRVLSFSADEIRAAISAGHYRDETAGRLFDILWARRTRIARAYLAEVAPLERFRFDGDKMCFDDLWIDAGLDEGKPAAYRVKGAAPVTFGPGSERCTVVPAASGYHVVTLQVKRAGEHTYGRRLDVHLVRDGQALRVVGLDR